MATQIQRIAHFATHAQFESLSPQVRTQLKIRILDALGCAIGALDSDLATQVRKFGSELGGAGKSRLIGGGSLRSDLAAFYNAALVRYLDFNDSYLAPGETCHPSDNLGAVLAAGELAGISGRTLMTALAVAYQVQCRRSDVAPVRDHGFDHTVQGAYAATAGIGRALNVDDSVLANAIAISATALNALRVTRTGTLSNWKGLAYPHMAADCVRNVLLARHGITGPIEAMEGNKGFMQVVSGPFNIDWEKVDFERVTRTVIKCHNAEIHSQSTLEAVLRLRSRHQLRVEDIAAIRVEIFDVGYRIIGGGEEGNKHFVQSKEQADHSLPYLVAVALLDGQVTPEQYAPQRILRRDVQQLMRTVSVAANEGYSRRFPASMPARVTVILRNGRVLEEEADTWPGGVGTPMDWPGVVHKFEQLAAPYTTVMQRGRIAAIVAELELHSLAEVMDELAAINPRHVGEGAVLEMRRAQ